MKLKLILVIILGTVYGRSAAQVRVIDLWANDKDSVYIPAPLNDAETTDELGFVRNISRAELFVYPASKEKNSGKAVIICPGGGYGGVSMRAEGRECAQWLAENGITAAVLKYRMPFGNHLIPYQDALKAMAMMRDSSAVWNFDINKIGVAGFSAGGHLASTMAVRMDPAFQVLFYPVITSREGVCHEGSFWALTGGNVSLKKYCSNELNINESTPPALIFHCNDDTVVDIANSAIYRDELIKNNIPVTYVVYPSGGHGWGMKASFPYHNQMRAQMLNFILNN